MTSADRDDLGERLQALERQLNIVINGTADRPRQNIVNYFDTNAYHENLLRFLQMQLQFLIILEAKLNKPS